MKTLLKNGGTGNKYDYEGTTNGRPFIFTRKITNLQGCPLSIRIYIFFGKSVFPQQNAHKLLQVRRSNDI